jgi:flagellar protein FliS
MIQELVAANVTGDADRTAVVRVDLVEPLAEAWRQAALDNLTGVAAPTPL